MVNLHPFTKIVLWVLLTLGLIIAVVFVLINVGGSHG